MPNYWHSCNQHTVHFCISKKGHYFVKKCCRVMALSQIEALVMVNKHMKFHEICFNTYKLKPSLKFVTNYWHSCYQHTVHFCISIKGHNFVKKPCRVMVLGQIEALVMMNKHMKFLKICFNTYKVIAKVKVCDKLLTLL